MRRGRSNRSIELVDAAVEILREIQPASVRACCYKLFTLGLIDSMAKSETSRVSVQLTWAREHHVIPWTWIVDDTREVERQATWENPTDYIEVVQRSYRKDRWTLQPEWVEIWSEKGTIRGTIAPVLERYAVSFRPLRGYGSATSIHEAAEDSLRNGQKELTAFYLGDWDPSGKHMSDVDLPARIERYGGVVQIVRLALTEADTLAGLPSFKVKTKKLDPRYRWFVERYGTTCWELDALSPVTLRDRVEQTIVQRLDLAAWQRADLVEAAEKESLQNVLAAWPGSISGQVQKYDPPSPPPHEESHTAIDYRRLAFETVLAAATSNEHSDIPYCLVSADAVIERFRRQYHRLPASAAEWKQWVVSLPAPHGDSLKFNPYMVWSEAAVNKRMTEIRTDLISRFFGH